MHFSKNDDLISEIFSSGLFPHRPLESHFSSLLYFLFYFLKILFSWISFQWGAMFWKKIIAILFQKLITFCSRFFRSWNSSTLVTSCEELTHWKRPWCWKGLGAGGEGDDRGWDGWMASATQGTWVWVNSGSWWWTGRPGVLWFMGLQRVRHDWATELNWERLYSPDNELLNVPFIFSYFSKIHTSYLYFGS